MQSTESSYCSCKWNISYNYCFTLKAFNQQNACRLLFWSWLITGNTMCSISLASLTLSIINNVFVEQNNGHFSFFDINFKYVWEHFYNICESNGTRAERRWWAAFRGQVSKQTPHSTKLLSSLLAPKIFWSNVRCFLCFTLTTNASSCWSTLLHLAIFKWNVAVSSAALCSDTAGCRMHR